MTINIFNSNNYKNLLDKIQSFSNHMNKPPKENLFNRREFIQTSTVKTRAYLLSTPFLISLINSCVGINPNKRSSNKRI